MIQTYFSLETRHTQSKGWLQSQHFFNQHCSIVKGTVRWELRYCLMLMYWSDFSKLATSTKFYSWKIGFHHFVLKNDFVKANRKNLQCSGYFENLANDCPQESEVPCTRYYFPAILPNIQFTSRCQRCFCFSVCFEIYFPATNKACEFI